MTESFKTPENLDIYEEHYNETSFWEKIKKEASKIGEKALYSALVLYYTAIADTTPLKKKTMIFGALGYFLLPLDIIPDFMAVIGYTDDIAVMTALISTLADSITPQIREEAKAKCQKLLGTNKPDDQDDCNILNKTVF